MMYGVQAVGPSPQRRVALGTLALHALLDSRARPFGLQSKLGHCTPHLQHQLSGQLHNISCAFCNRDKHCAPLVRSGTAYIESGAQMPCSQLSRSFLCPKNTFATNEISSTCSPAVDQIRLYLISLHGVNPKAPLSGSFGARLPEVHLGVAGEDGEADHVAMPHSRLLAGVYACRLQVACKGQGLAGSLAAVHGF